MWSLVLFLSASLSSSVVFLSNCHMCCMEFFWKPFPANPAPPDSVFVLRNSITGFLPISTYCYLHNIQPYWLE
ncbi:hypothetical protein KC19_3G134300 [Ceratodon purpureus]|uniref:Secreted protein n=1 Tax=Ceratodon purpureus TaxID=3225 RepID=A0A8T0IHZ5_CERPU|nr:hypothetical protein KC19_3G134300 [Ceratodon purpureus]